MRGFLLLEVLITTILLVLGLTGVMWAFNSGLFAFKNVEGYDLALNTANKKMEEIFNLLKNTDFEALDTAAFEAAHSGTDPDFPGFSVAVGLADGQNPMQADVTVSWDTKGGTDSITLTTLVADY